MHVNVNNIVLDSLYIVLVEEKILDTLEVSSLTINYFICFRKWSRCAVEIYEMI